MDERRSIRISNEIKKVLTQKISREIENPKVDPLLTITNVKLSKDLSYADIYVSMIGTDWHKKQCMIGLEDSKGFLRSAVAREINLRKTPILRFHLDDSIEYSARISSLIDEVIDKDKKNALYRLEEEKEEIDE